jgi:paraquat-inducible protein B
VKTKISPAIVGAFVIGAFALGMIALLSFGGISLFGRPERFVVYFDESTHGLDLGSAVKLQGVRVGRVVSLNIRYFVDSNAKNRAVVAVVCELNKDIMTDSHGAVIDVSNRAELENLVQRGLRAKLEVAGLATGLLFVQLEFRQPGDTQEELKGTHDRYVVVPSVHSAISEFQKGIGELLANVKNVDLAKVARDISALADTARKQIDGVDLRGVTEQWKKTGAQFEAFAKDPEFKKTFDSLNAAVSDLRGMIAKLDAQIEPTSKELATTLADARKSIQAFSDTAASARSFIAAHAGLGEDLGDTLEHLNDAADAVRRLADFLERNPNALITGRRHPAQQEPSR